MEKYYGIKIEQLKKIIYKKSLNRDRSQKEFEFFNEFCLCSQKKVGENHLELWLYHYNLFLRSTAIAICIDLRIIITYFWSWQETCTLNWKFVWISHVYCFFRESNSATGLVCSAVRSELSEMSSWVSKLNRRARIWVVCRPVKAENQNKALIQLPQWTDLSEKERPQ